MSFGDILLWVALVSFVLTVIVAASGREAEGLVMAAPLAFICFAALAIYVIRAVLVVNGCEVDITFK